MLHAPVFHTGVRKREVSYAEISEDLSVVCLPDADCGLLSACGSSEAEESSGTWQTFRTRGAHETIRILSGSENQELASILGAVRV